MAGDDSKMVFPASFASAATTVYEYCCSLRRDSD
jgi:hypothetical protein